MPGSSELGRVFAGIGAGFGAVFIAVNAGGLPGPWDVVTLLAGAVLLVLAVWRGFFGPSSFVASGDRGAIRTYWFAVAAEILAIPAGAFVINRLERPELVVLWVVLVVGAHFLPARAFGIGRFFELGCALMLVALVFGAARLVTGRDWLPSAGAVVAGAVMLGFVALRPGSRPAQP